jgi:hypothetical protein
MADTFTVQLFEDENGELVLPIPVEISHEMDWQEGDTLAFELSFEDTVLIYKVEENFDEEEADE